MLCPENWFYAKARPRRRAVPYLGTGPQIPCDGLSARVSRQKLPKPAKVKATETMLAFDTAGSFMNGCRLCWGTPCPARGLLMIVAVVMMMVVVLLLLLMMMMMKKKMMMSEGW